jgi:ribonuclease P protein component
MQDRRFPRRDRLLRSRDYQRVFRAPLKSADRYFTVLARARDPNLTETRLGLAISRKAAPRAVDRTRIKRLARESFRYRDRKAPAVDFVVMCRPAARTADNAVLLSSLQRHWQHLRERLCASSSG